MIQESAQTESPRVTRVVQKKGNAARFLLLIISYIIVGVAVWQIQAQVWKPDAAKQQALAEKEVKDVVTRVGSLMILPSNETPQVATIEDAESLAKTQAFFANSTNGDQILIYLKDQKAIIYRPSENIIVNVGPIITDNSGTTTPKSSNSSQTTSTSNTSVSTSSRSN